MVYCVSVVGCKLNILLFLRILLGEEFASVLLWKVFSIGVMVIRHVKVFLLNYSTQNSKKLPLPIISHYLITLLKMISYFPRCWYVVYSFLYLTAFGPARCSLNNGGCWSETRDKITFSACSVQYCLTESPVFLLAPFGCKILVKYRFWSV